MAERDVQRVHRLALVELRADATTQRGGGVALFSSVFVRPTGT